MGFGAWIDSYQKMIILSIHIFYNNKDASMPYKHNLDRKHKYKKPKYIPKNCHEYDKALKNRGGLTIWFSKEAINSR